MMLRFLSILSMFFFMSCVNPLDVPIHNKKWRTIKQVVTTTDKTGNSTNEKVKDFSIMDYLNFDDTDKLSIVSYGSTTKYQYKIKDSILTFWPEKAEQKANVYRIKVSTKDSLVLTRTESWGSDSALKITGTFHLAAVKQ